MSAYYVAINGNDSWTGLLPAPNVGNTDGPHATVRHATSNTGLLPGDTIYVRQGIYQNDVIAQTPNSAPSGALGNPITLTSYPGEYPTIQLGSTYYDQNQLYKSSVIAGIGRVALYPPSNGAYTISWSGHTTTSLPYNTSVSGVQAALHALPGGSGIAVASGGMSSQYVIEGLGTNAVVSATSGATFTPINWLGTWSGPDASGMYSLPLHYMNQGGGYIFSNTNGPVIGYVSGLTVVDAGASWQNAGPLSNLNTVQDMHNPPLTAHGWGMWFFDTMMRGDPTCVLNYTATNGALTSVSVNTNSTGYQVGDLIIVDSWSRPAFNQHGNTAASWGLAQVTAINADTSIASLSVYQPGQNYANSDTVYCNMVHKVYFKPPAQENMTLTVLGTSGTYQLAHNGNNTSNLAYNASPSTIQSALNGLPGVSGITVSQFFTIQGIFPNVATPLTAGSGANVSFGGVLNIGDFIGTAVLTVSATSGNYTLTWGSNSGTLPWNADAAAIKNLLNTFTTWGGGYQLYGLTVVPSYTIQNIDLWSNLTLNGVGISGGGGFAVLNSDYPTKFHAPLGTGPKLSYTTSNVHDNNGWTTNWQRFDLENNLWVGNSTNTNSPNPYWNVNNLRFTNAYKFFVANYEHNYIDHCVMEYGGMCILGGGHNLYLTNCYMDNSGPQSILNPLFLEYPPAFTLYKNHPSTTGNISIQHVNPDMYGIPQTVQITIRESGGIVFNQSYARGAQTMSGLCAAINAISAGSTYTAAVTNQVTDVYTYWLAPNTNFPVSTANMSAGSGTDVFYLLDTYDSPVNKLSGNTQPTPIIINDTSQLTIQFGGTGYVVGNQVNIQGGGKIQVSSVSAGAITAFSVVTDYNSYPLNTTLTTSPATGAGGGCTLILNSSSNPFQYLYTSAAANFTGYDYSPITGYSHIIYWEGDDQDNSVVDNCYFGDTTGYDASWRSGGGDTFTNNVFDNYVGGGLSVGIGYPDGSGNLIRNNICHVNSPYYPPFWHDGLAVFNPYGTLNNSTIINNTIRANTGGINYTSTGMDTCVLCNNIIQYDMPSNRLNKSLGQSYYAIFTPSDLPGFFNSTIDYNVWYTVQDDGVTLATPAMLFYSSPDTRYDGGTWKFCTWYPRIATDFEYHDNFTIYQAGYAGNKGYFDYVRNGASPALNWEQHSVAQVDPQLDNTFLPALTSPALLQEAATYTNPYDNSQWGYGPMTNNYGLVGCGANFGFLTKNKTLTVTPDNYGQNIKFILRDQESATINLGGTTVPIVASSGSPVVAGQVMALNTPINVGGYQISYTYSAANSYTVSIIPFTSFAPAVQVDAGQYVVVTGNNVSKIYNARRDAMKDVAVNGLYGYQGVVIGFERAWGTQGVRSAAVSSGWMDSSGNWTDDIGKYPSIFQSNIANPGCNVYLNPASGQQISPIFVPIVTTNLVYGELSIDDIGILLITDLGTLEI